MGFSEPRAAFPARAPFRLASIPLLGEGKGTGLLQARRLFPFRSHTASVVRSGPAEGSFGCPRTKPHSSPGPASSPAARPQMGCAGTPSRDPGARPAWARTGPRFRRPALARATAASIWADSTVRICRSRFHFRARDQRTPSLFSVEILRLLSRLVQNRAVSFHGPPRPHSPRPRLHPCPSGWYGPKFPEL